MNYREVEVVGAINFDGISVPVYEDLNEPLFRIQDVARMLSYQPLNANHLLKFCEKWEQQVCITYIGGQRRRCNFITEKGIYNILAQSRCVTARKWRQVVFDQLIEMRKNAGRNIEDQFSEYARANESNMDDEWFDEDTGKWMYACTVPGGDVEIFEKRMPF